MPHLEVVDKLSELPIIESTYNKSSEVYTRVKSSSPIINTTLTSAESALHVAANLVSPIAEQFRQPINSVDQKLCSGLDTLQEKIPIVRDTPDEIYAKARGFVAPKVNQLSSAAVSNASFLKEKANIALRSPIGSIAMAGLDMTSNIADKCLDYVFPPLEGEDELHPHSNTFCDDKVYHAVHTVGTLTIKAGRKVFRSINRSPYNINNNNPPPPQTN